MPAPPQSSGVSWLSSRRPLQPLSLSNPTRGLSAPLRSIRASPRCWIRRPIWPMSPRWHGRRLEIRSSFSCPAPLASSRLADSSGAQAAPTTTSPGSSRISIGPWAARPISGRLASFIRRRSIRPVLLATTRRSPSWPLTTRRRLTPSLSLSTVVARPDNSWNSPTGRRLKRPSLLSSPRLPCFGSGST